MSTEKWSATRIDTANYCQMKYYLKYVETPRPKSINPSAFKKGSLFHKSIETFWLFMDPIAYKNNPLLSKQIEEYKERHEVRIKEMLIRKGWRELPVKYDDSESFSKYVVGQWIGKYVIPDSNLRKKLRGSISKDEKINLEKFLEKATSDEERDNIKKELKKYISDVEKLEIGKKLVEWSFDGEPYVFKEKLPTISKPLYNYLYNEGPPLYSELSFDFELNNLQINGEDLGRIRFNGHIDEVRLRKNIIVIRDFKSGSPWGIKDMKRDFDPQLTFYNLGLCSLAYEDYNFAKIIGVENIADKFMGNPIYIYPEFEHEFFMVEALSKFEESKMPESKIKSIPEPILKTKRTDVHFNELIKMIHGTKQIRNRKNIYAESGRKCDLCDMKKACAEKIYENQDQLIISESGQRFLSFIDAPTRAVVSTSIKRKKKRSKRNKYEPSEGQKKFHFGRKEGWKGTKKTY